MEYLKLTDIKHNASYNKKNMRSLYTTILALGLLLSEQQVYAQAHNVSAGYQKPVDPLVIENLESWQDMKFGLFMHWGTYSQWGIVESWSLCPEDEGWTQRKAEHGKTYYEYVKKLRKPTNNI